MTKKLPPRLLVVDDDLGVIAAYRLVLEKSTDRRTVQDMFGLDALEKELFGAIPADVPQWRITFLDQGIDAVNAVQWAMEDGDPFTAIFLDVRMPPGIDGYEVAERVIAHLFGSAVSRVYDRNEYLREKRAALDRWEEVLRKIVG